jgi:oxidoreductase
LAIGFFGDPISSHYTAQQLPNSVDLYGQGVLIYPDFQVAIQAGKNITSHLPAEIYTKTGTLTLNAVTAINQARFVSHSGEVIDLPIQPCPHQMQEEAGAFSLAIAHQKPSLISNGYKQLSRSIKPSTRCVKALEYNLRMKKNERTISTKLERPVRNTRI